MFSPLIARCLLHPAPLGQAIATSSTTWDTSFNANYSYTSGNATATRNAGTGDQLARANAGKTSGFFIVTPTIAGTDVGIGFGKSTSVSTDWAGTTGTIGYHPNGNIFANGAGVVAVGATYTASDAIKSNFDGTFVQFYKNGVAQVSGSGIDVSTYITVAYPIAQSTTSGDAFAADFGGW